MVNAVVCIKRTLDVAQLKVDPATRAPVTGEVPYRISDFDENALEEGIRFKEKHGGRVVAVTAGVPEARDIMRKALAMGADEAHVAGDAAFANSDSLATARILGALIRKLGPFDIVVCGEGSVDEYNAQVGPRLGEELGVPCLTHVVRAGITDGKMVAERNLEEYVEVVESPLPVVLTVVSEINQARLPTLLQIMGASKKPLKVWSAVELGLSLDRVGEKGSGIRTLSILAPVAERRRIRIEGEPSEAAPELAKRLVEEGVVKL